VPFIIRRLALLLVGTSCLIVAASAPAEAVTAREIMELARAGISEDVLIQLIETDSTIFSLDADQILELKTAGVSDRVILAMLRSGRMPREQTPLPRAPDPPPAAAPSDRVIDPGSLLILGNDPEPPSPTVLAVPMPVVVPVFVASPFGVGHHRFRTFHQIPTTEGGHFGRFINDGFVPRVDVQPSGKPVYWGWGGKLRPDAWGQKAPPK